jgi:hypothetical protein
VMESTSMKMKNLSSSVWLSQATTQLCSFHVRSKTFSSVLLSSLGSISGLESFARKKIC